ncbi:O-antigen translocase [Butyricimonas paravirosa]|uniref:O-antigen translocase n=1 Tax=Butyricimonas paravirosa TaxID=1472417 RepID=UPI00210AF301|nr:O-antigen translocase [Butyricimonas paravirosa]MCQ4872509.1 O-antigen translocase [Butyricimonas paravirosa]
MLGTSSSAKDNSSYKESLKATSLFGGVQVFNILIGVIRSKFIAILLGPSGMGMYGLFTLTTSLISSFTNCGLGTSAVRNIAEANSTRDQNRIALIISVFRKLVWFTGLIGMSVCVCFASFFSKLTFGDTSYTCAFMLLSVTILLTQLTAGQNALLQGLRKYKYLASANVLGHVLALLTTIPLYYFWGVKAIVPSIMIMGIVTFSLARYFSGKVKIEKKSAPIAVFKSEGGNMLKMGIFISLQSLLSILTSYIVRIYISRTGGLDDVGFYTAGFTIINSYVGLIFTAMSTDYYPRLSGVASSNSAMNKMINQQAEIALLLLAPIISLFIVFAKWGVVILYSQKFLAMEGMLYWAMFGIFFKAMGWSVAYSFLAKSDTKVFFWNEFSAVVYTFILNIVGYQMAGLTGLGISFCISFLVYFIQVIIVCGKRYGYKMEKKIVRIFSVQLILSTVCVIVKVLSPNLVSYPVGSIIFLVLTFYSYRELDKILDIKRYIKSFRSTKK